ncbi:precorrin-6y C5,15-methyltransferase (decarboxylating) subunit CbiE [uncultured Roseobacter sp.]|uniref:precorrin-6y C5,15-methyltransferase (decarboxylating) subunit CbiE n=1 Tax=uncultured Roseobacter sp. TaxID=114847 RepID=UPI002625AA43|nr:precorrin-6y C5,15-methyltransferase (decarboxylating) subunit CbiE [uncultured Roseobacter sp.]
MSETPWLTIVGLGEDGPGGLGSASRKALAQAEIIMGPPRHLALLKAQEGELIPWPVPFADGVELLLEQRGKRVVVLASGDPFWFGAGSVLARHLDPGEWRCLPGRSTFSLAAAQMGWPLEETTCLGLHAAPLARLRPHLAQGARCIVLLRDGAAVQTLATYLTDTGFGASTLTVFEALGGPRQTVTEARAEALPDRRFEHPVCAAVTCAGADALPLVPGRSDDWFENDGQITKSPVRAMTLAALGPLPFEHLWDIGGGSGSIAIEWLLAHPSLSATSFERDPARVARITDNAARLGVDRLQVVTGSAPEVLGGPPPQAVFIGGGLSDPLLSWLRTHLATGTRLVANAVTLETEALLVQAQAEMGGDLLRLQLARSEPLGPRRGWAASYPIVQWSVRL